LDPVRHGLPFGGQSAARRQSRAGAQFLPRETRPLSCERVDHLQVPLVVLVVLEKRGEELIKLFAQGGRLALYWRN
jgi:hypothetical protein